jgi:hypothetical protein
MPQSQELLASLAPAVWQPDHGAAGEERCVPLRGIAAKTAKGWVLLTFFVDMRHACSTLGPLS